MKQKHDILLRGIKILNVILITFPFAAGWMLYYAGRTAEPYYAKGNYLIIFLFMVLYVVYGHVYDAFMVSIIRISEMIYSQSLAAFISDGIMYIVCWLLTKHLPAVWPLLLVFAGQILLSALWSYLASNWYFNTFPPKRTAVIYDSKEGIEGLLTEYGLDRKFEVCRILSVDECMEGNMTCLDDMDTAFICGVHSHERNAILKHCIYKDVSAYVIPRIGDILMSGAKRMHMLHLPILLAGRYNPRIEYLMVKRIVDILVSAVALLLLFPIMLATAIAIKAEDGGPVFYKQSRLTKDGKQFDVLKFRSMRTDAEKDGVARLSTGDKDDRITLVGRFIRKVRIDELPQIINILKGEMTIVGPRPERPEIAAEYEKDLPEFAMRLQAKAGLTGYAQVYGKYNTTPYDKLQMDLMYISKPSIIEDLRIIFATVKILFVPESTEGIAEGNTNAGSVSKEPVLEVERAEM